MIIFIIFISITFSEYFIKPIKLLSHTAYEIAKGNYNISPVKHLSKNEIGLLAFAFNKMIKEVKDNAENLEKKVIKRTDELEKANQSKTTFFINLAHETKTPLTLIKNYLEKYIHEFGINNDLQIIKQNIDKLLADMVNFLDAEKLSRNQIFYDHNQNIDLSDLISNKIILFKEIALKKQITINSKIDNYIIIKADPFAIDRVINNLLDNSIKYNDQSGTISVITSISNDKVHLIVSDNGIGMSEDQLNNIFKPYHQLSNNKRNIQGIGMGLNIVYKIIQSLNGEINVESKLNEGTTFTIVFNKYVFKRE